MDEEAEATPKPNKLKAFLPYIGILLAGLGGGYGASIALAPPPEESEEGEEADEGGASAEGHGEAKADAHGAPKDDGHGAPKEDAHGAPKDDGHGAPKDDGHGAAKADAHGAPAAGGHGAAPAAEASSHLAAGLTGGSLVTNLGTFTINLRGSGGGRVVRMEVQLDSDAPTGTTVKERTPQLRDSIISAVSDYTWSELEGVDGKTRLREELLARVNGVVNPGAVDRLYFTQFVVQ